jgi:hypothetical protein
MALHIHFVAACSTGVMASEGRIEVKVVNDNQITLKPPGTVDVETTYVRCAL